MKEHQSDPQTSEQRRVLLASCTEMLKKLRSVDPQRSNRYADIGKSFELNAFQCTPDHGCAERTIQLWLYAWSWGSSDFTKLFVSIMCGIHRATILDHVSQTIAAEYPWPPDLGHSNMDPRYFPDFSAWAVLNDNRAVRENLKQSSSAALSYCRLSVKEGNCDCYKFHYSYSLGTSAQNF